MVKLFQLVTSIIVTFTAGVVGSVATFPSITTWYAALKKPALNPPNWVFGQVWTLLYSCMAIALYLVWTSPSKRPKQAAYIAFGTQLVLNAAWSIVFFGLHQPAAAVVVLVAMLGAIAATIAFFWRISRTAAYLLVPYFLWICFAGYLNISVAVLN